MKMGFRGQWGVDRLSSQPEDSGPPAPYGDWDCGGGNGDWDWDWGGGNGPREISNC